MSVLKIENKRKQHDEAMQYIFKALENILSFTLRVSANDMPTPQRVHWLEKTIEYVVNVQGKYEQLFARVNDPKIRKCKKGFIAIRNHATCVLSFIEEGELTKKDLAEYETKQKNRCEKLNRLILEVSERVNESLDKRKAKEAGEDDFDAPEPEEINSEEAEMKELQTVEVANSIEEVFRNAGPLLKDYARQSSNLPKVSDKTKPFLIKRFPVIPLFTNILTPQDLEDVGFDVKKVGNYMVLENQLVIGENLDLMATMVKKKVQNPSNRRRKMEVEVKDKEDAPTLDDVLKVIQQRAGKRFAKMPQVVRSYHGFRWHWLVPERMLTQLDRERKHFTVRAWGFPFQPPK